MLGHFVGPVGVERKQRLAQSLSQRHAWTQGREQFTQLLQVRSRLESESGVRHVIAEQLVDLTPLLSGLDVPSRDFR